MFIFDNDNRTEEDGNSLLAKFQNFNISAPFDDVPLNGDFYWLLTCLVLCIIWIVYIVFYNSRLFGFILTKLINHVIIPRYLYKGCKKENHPFLHIGSFSITIISGKIMFRDLIFITADYSLRIQDGLMIFKWWVPYEPKNVRTTDFSQSDTRVSFLFNGFELHIFNRSELYAQLEKVFKLPTRFLDLEHNLIKEKILKNVENSLTNDKLIKAYLWKDFFPVTKFEINNGRLVFGNSNVPTTLLITFEESHITYTSKSAISKHDLFTHISKSKIHTFKIILANSPNYNGLRIEEPPRYMGEGFVVFQSNLIDLYYYQDEPGFANSQPEIFELSTGDTITRFTSPAWGMDVKSGKNTDLRYGPWADRQRDYLYNFFYPLDFQYIPSTTRAKEGELRFFEKFDFRFSTLSTANIDILFTDAKRETNVMHLNSGAGSYLEVTVPLISKEEGYHSDIVGQILHLDSTTTLAYRPLGKDIYYSFKNKDALSTNLSFLLIRPFDLPLAESETLEFKIRIEYPRMWNHHQTWHCNFTGCKTSANLLFAHKIFFQNLIDDWAGKDKLDMLKFVPYTCKINLILKEFEIILIANEYNWIDCTSKTKNENIELAICGDTYDMSFDLSFAEFAPDLTLYKIWIQGESLEAALHVPEINPHYETIKIMHKFAKMYPLLPNNDLNIKNYITTKDLYAGENKWRNVAKMENGWFTCWSVPIVAIDITYHHHPVPIKTFDKTKIDEDLGLRNSRFIKNFDPGEMQPDLAEIEIEIGPSKICLHGLLLRALWNIKENYMGESQLFNDFSINPEIINKTANQTSFFTTTNNLDKQPFDERLYRPFAVTVSVIMHDLHGHLMKNCFEKDVNKDSLCPYVYLEKLCFEMDKTYRETKLQLLLSPVIVRTSDLVKRSKNNSHLNNGHLLMSSLQFRGHALFSGLGRSLLSETLEYGWLVEVEIAKLSGKLTAPQLYNIVGCLETFVFQLIQPDSALQPPVPYHKCLHDKLQTQCSESDINLNKICPNSEDIKYKMVRFSVQSIDLCLVESHNLIYIQITPIKFSTCNLHSCHSNNGITLLINNVFIKHFIIVDNQSFTNLNASEHKITSLKDDLIKEATNLPHQHDIKHTKCYEALNIEFGPLFIDTAELISIVESYTISQKKFLSIHDAKTKKLWFLWNDKFNTQQSTISSKCGCVGGCAFFGNNLNGRNFFNLNSRDLVDSKIYEKRSEETINEKFEKGYDFMYGESLLNPGEPILGLKLNSIYEESEENLNSNALGSPIDDLKFTTHTSTTTYQNSKQTYSPALINYRTSSPFNFNNKLRNSHLSSTNSMSPTLFNKSKFNNLNMKSTQSQLDNTSSNRKLHRSHLFTDKNRSLSETGIEKSSKFDKPDRLSNLKELPIDAQSIELIKTQSKKLTIKNLESPSIKSVRSQQSTATSGNERYFSVEELLSDESPTKSQGSTHSTSEEYLVDEGDFKETKKKRHIKSSRSSSNSSFQSACSSPKEEDEVINSEEDNDDSNNEDDDENDDNQSFYDLRDQMQKPILESPLLMSTYSNYLTLYQCDNWKPKTETVNLLTSNYIPIMKQTTFDGFSSINLIKKRKQPISNKRLNRQNKNVNDELELDDENYEPGSVYEHIDDLDSAKKEGFHKTHRRQDSSERVMNLGKLEKQISKTIEIRNEKITILIKLNGDTEIKISPLCLDGLKTFIEALTPTLEKAHPLTIVNHINTLCYKNVASKNHLKKEKIFEYGQLKLKAWHSTMERENNIFKNNNSNNSNNYSTNQNTSNMSPNLQNSNSVNLNSINNQQQSINNPSTTTRTSNFFESRKQPAQQAATVITANQFEETKNTKFQLFIQISNINIYILQASLVEQLVDSSTFEHINDCTCVSLFALNIGRLNFDYFNNKKERRSLHTFITNNSNQPPASIFAALTQKDLVSKLFSKKVKKEQKEVEPLTIETQELLLEESVGLGTVTKLHVQLNRLKNSSSLLNDALLTIIPKNNSKVDFEIVNLVNSNINNTQEPIKPLRKSQSLNPKASLHRQDCLKENDANQLNDDQDTSDLLSGFIMFEAGLENIRVNGVKKKIITDEKSCNKTQLNNNNDTNSKKEDNIKNEDNKIDEEIKVEEENKEENNKQGDTQINKDQISNFKNNASSLGGQIQVIWFNFASPSKTPNTKKIDFTKLDWHLISTATPAINAWLGSGDRVLLSAKKCSLYYERRVASVLACLMSAALEIPGIHIQPKSRYWTNRLTPFSKSLYEDPSYQLMSVLRRYLSRWDSLKEIEKNLDVDSLPPLKILRKGIISLSRSWKNALYMPLLVEQNIKLSRGEGNEQNQKNIPLRLLINEKNANLNLNEVSLRRKSSAFDAKAKIKVQDLRQKTDQPSQYLFNKDFKQPTSGQTSKYETVLFMNPDDENINETTNLLFEDDQRTKLINDNDDINKLNSETSSHHGRQQIDELSNESSNKPRFIPNMIPRSSLAFPLLTNPLESIGTGVNNIYGFLFNPSNCANGTTLQSKRSKNLQIKDELIDSSDSSDEVSEFNLNLLNDTQLNNYKRSNEENLYNWAIKQQDYVNSKNLPSSFTNGNLEDFNTLATKHSTLKSATSDELELNDNLNDKGIDILPNFLFVPTSIQLGDVKVIFEPLLVSLAIENLDETDSNIAFEQLGTKIALSLIIKQFKIEIVESEHRGHFGRNGHSPYHKINPQKQEQSQQNVLINEPSAFECDFLNIGLNLRKVKDFNTVTSANRTDSNRNSNSQTTKQQNETEKMPIIIVGPEGGLNEVTTIVNFNIETNRIIQRVNLPLLRLIHQVASVFENVKETRLVMKSNKVNKWKQSIFLGDLKNEQLLSFSLNNNNTNNTNQVNNRHSTHSNITNSAIKDHVTIDMELSDDNQNDDEEKLKLKRVPTCWRNMYCLLNLYETTPETKTVTDRNSYLQKQQQQVQSNYYSQQINYSDLNQHTINNTNQQSETRIQIEEISNRKRNYTGDNQPNFDQQQPNNDEVSPNEMRKSIVGGQSINYNAQFRKSLVNVMSSDHIKTYTHVLMQRESTPFVVFGVLKIKKVNLEAKLSNLKLDGELSSFHVSLTHKEKIKGASVQMKKWKESSLTGNLGSSKISILEETQFNNHQLIVKMTIGKSLTLVSSQNKKGKDHNSALLKIGAINIDIPQHPVALHGMMTRSSRQLSTTLQEFKTQRGIYRSATTTTSTANKQNDNLDNQQQQQQQQFSNIPTSSNLNSEDRQTTFESTTETSKDQFDSTIKFRDSKSRHASLLDKKEEKFIRPIVVQFQIVLDSFEIGASLLPSLKAQYSIGQIISAGITGRKAKFTIDFEEHKLSFNTKISETQKIDSNQPNLPSSASVSLPKIHVSAEYMEETKKKSSSFVTSKQQQNNANSQQQTSTSTSTNQQKNTTTNANATKSDSFIDGIVLRKGSYLNALAEIGGFEHSLTTDLLNHLLLVQKVFMKEVNEILQKMSGFDNENHFMSKEERQDKKNKSKITTRHYLLFTLHLRMKGIQITATTPTNSAVRLETGKIDLQLSNRVQNMLKTSTKKSSQLDLNLKLFVKLQLDLMVALGQLFQNPMYEEANPEFQQLAYFRTRIIMRNALQNELISSTEEDHNNGQEEKEAVLIVLKRPLLYIQPIALDKAVLVWLNYKNAYDYWSEKRADLNTEVKSATQQVLDKIPINQINTGSLSTLFLQLTIDDLGICLPIQTAMHNPQQQLNMSSFTTSKIAYDSELKSAFVITLESTSISACSFNSWASKAKFTGLCIRFADDFETSLDDWKPAPNDYSIMNLCVVSGGTYEICSKTTTTCLGVDAKWWLNVCWRMDGFDIHVDTSIGKQLTSLFKTLTALAGEDEFNENCNKLFYLEEEDEEEIDEEKNKEKSDDKTDGVVTSKQSAGNNEIKKKLSSLYKQGSKETYDKELSRRIEIELNKLVNSLSDLRQRNASEDEIEREAKKLHDLEQLVFLKFKQKVSENVLNKLKRKPSIKNAEFRSRSNTLTQPPFTPAPKPQQTKSLSASQTESKLPFLRESSSLDNSNDIGPISPTESEMNSPLTKSYSKDNSSSKDDEQSDEENVDSLYYLNSLLPKTFYRYKTQNSITTSKSTNKELTQSTTNENTSRSFQNSQTESNLFSNLMNLPSFINTSFSSSALPTTDNVLGKLFNLSPTHHNNTSSNTNTSKLSSSSISANSNVFDFDQDSDKTTSQSGSKQTSPLANQANSSSTYLIQEPSVDFELDIKVYFNSGKCVLHTKDPMSKDDSLSNKKSASLPKEKSFSSNPYENTPQSSFYSQSAGYNKFLRANSSKQQANTSGTNLGGSNSNQTTGGLKFNTSSSRLRAGNVGTQNLLDYTTFLIPGLDIKLHYNSKTVFPNQPQSTAKNLNTTIPSTSNVNHLSVLHENFTDQDNQRMKRLGGTKKATCYAWMTLHSIPEETVITPHLLNFLEEALEPIPIIVPPSRTASQNNLDNDSNEQRSDLITNGPAQYAVYGSFPVDVIVYLHVQQSVLRFSCLPTSRVECLLQLPSVDLVFSSKRIEDELSGLNKQTSSATPNVNTHKRTHSVPGTATFNNNKFGHRRLGSDYRHQGQDASVGGLSVTGYLADFSLYIFHPYTSTKPTISTKLNTGHDRHKSSTPKISTERKDSLSLQVEFVKINISRSRKVTYSYNQSNLFDFNSKPNSPCSNQRITIRFSGLCDIGSASFKYDIRRLSEILAFPKAWYRKTLWKRVFLGDQGVSNEVILNNSNINLDVDSPNLGFRLSASDEDDINQTDLLGEEEDGYKSSDDQGLKIKITSKLSPDRICDEITNEQLEKSNEKLKSDKNENDREDNKQKKHHQRTKSLDSSSITHQQKKQLLNTPWETLILFGVNLSKLNIHMNMGNVMGNTSWLTKEFRSEGKIVIDSTGHRSMNISLGLDNSTLDAKSGIVGGQIELSKIETKLNVKEFYGLEPDHVITTKLNAIQTRIDYMGSPILMLRMSNLDLRLKDEWKIDTELKKTCGFEHHPTKRPALMFIHCILSWDQLQILLSKSTTPDIIKIIAKLDEFFSKQFYSSKRVFTSLQKTQSFNRHSFKQTNKNQSTVNQSNNQLNQQQQQQPQQQQAQDNQQPKRPNSQLGNCQDAKHHRHWQKTLKIASGVYLHNFADPLPEIGTILGGTFELFGNNISIACFADINFRSKSWAIFSLRYPHISFTTEAQESVLMDEKNTKTHIIQNFSLSLGRRQNQEGYVIDFLYATHSSMATVCKISRNTMFSPQFKHLHEWFQYAFCASELDEVDRFPVIEFERFAVDNQLLIQQKQQQSNQNLSSEQGQTQVDGHISNVVGGMANVVAGVAAAASSGVQKTLGATFKKNQDDQHQKKLNSPKTNHLNHTKEIIFALPSLQLELKTDHEQDATVPILSDPKPRIDCTFITEFDDHIFVAVDIEAYFFLHNLISSYIKEKEITFNKSQSPNVQSQDKIRKSKNQQNNDNKDETKDDKIETDWREYNCQTWRLEPTVRLLSWAGKNIEPYGVDYILQRLGFTQARTTIPKWIQRMCMDPLDRTLSELMYQLIQSNKIVVNSRK